MEMKAGLTFACMNLKKLSKMKQRSGLMAEPIDCIFIKIQRNLHLKKSVPGIAS